MWDHSTETLLQRYGDEAQCRECLHRKSFYSYKRTLTCFQLPVIILSALSGSIQFLSKSFETAMVERAVVTCTASLSILTAVLSSVQSYLKLGEKASRHESAEVAWQNLHNSIKHQLGLARGLREDCSTFVDRVKQEYDRLFEISPILDQRFINEVRKKLRGGQHDEFHIPNYLNGFAPTRMFQEGWESNSP